MLLRQQINTLLRKIIQSFQQYYFYLTSFTHTHTHTQESARYKIHTNKDNLNTKGYNREKFKSLKGVYFICKTNLGVIRLAGV